MADISKVTLPSGTTYDIKDSTARQLIADLSNYTAFLGVTTTALTDGATTNPITIGGSSVTATTGNIVTYSSKEFIFNGTAWQEFGDLSGLGALAYKDSANGNVSVTTNQALTEVLLTYTGSKTEPDSDDALKEVTASAPTFTGTQKYLHLSTTKGTTTSTGNYTPSGTVTFSVGDETANYTPSGTVSTPTITVTPSTTTKYVASSATGGGSVTAGSAASFSATVSNENLTLGWTANTPTAVTLPSFSSQTIATGISSATSSQPTFTGTGANLKGTFTGTQGSVSVSTAGAVTAVSGSVNTTASGGIDIKPAGTVSAPELTKTYISYDLSKTRGTVTSTGTVTVS